MRSINFGQIFNRFFQSPPFPRQFRKFGIRVINFHMRIWNICIDGPDNPFFQMDHDAADQPGIGLVFRPGNQDIGQDLRLWVRLK